MRRTSATRLDPHAPLVLDTHELSRRPGSMRPLRFTVPAPEGLGLDLVRVPAGAPMELDLRLESVVEGVLVSGDVSASATGECARCLEPVTERLTVSLQELYAYPESDAAEEEVAGRLDGDLLDLEPALRDAVVLALPLAPLCRDDCGGLCPTCGVRLDEAPPGHGHEETDSRWAALAALRDAPARTDPES